MSEILQICALWRTESKDKKIYYRGILNPRVDVLLFPVEDGERRPAFDLCLAERKPREQKEGENA